KFWKELGKHVYEENKDAMKVNDEVRRASVEAIGDASAPGQKLERLVAFCRTKIKNIYDDTTVMSEQERKKLKDNRSPADTLKRRYGNHRGLHLLLAAPAHGRRLGAAADHPARPRRIILHPEHRRGLLPERYDVAVKVGADWKFVDPSSNYVPFGML